MLNFLFAWLAPSLVAAIIAQGYLLVAPSGPIKDAPVSVVLFMLSYGFFFSWAPLIFAIILGVLFLRAGIAGWAIVIALAALAGLATDFALTKGELFPYSGVVGAIYGLFLWGGLYMLNGSAIKTSKKSG